MWRRRETARDLKHTKLSVKFGRSMVYISVCEIRPLVFIDITADRSSRIDSEVY